MNLKAKSIKHFILTSGFLALFGFPSVTVFGQYNVAPSQTGMFFSDLRARANQVRSGTAVDQSQPSGATGTAGIYDFSRDQGQYTGQPLEQRDVGSPFGGYEFTRNVGTGNSQGSSRRLTGDYSAYGGPYPSTGTFFAPAYVSDPFLGGKRNIKLGPVNIGLGLTGALEYNDNITRASGIVLKNDVSTTASPFSSPISSNSSSNTEFIRGQKYSDLIGTAFLSIDANYAISQRSRLTLTTSIGYNYYFNHPEFSPQGKGNNFTILPGSSLAYDFKIGNLVFTLYDRISVRPGSNDNFNLDNHSTFGAVENNGGIAMNWAINSSLNLSLNFSRTDSRALEEDINGQFDRHITSISASLAWSPSGTWTAGLESSYSWTEYAQSYNNSGTSNTMGVFVTVPVSHNTNVRAAAGIQNFHFEAPPNFTRSVSDADLTATQNQITAINNQLAVLSPVLAANPAQQQAAQAALQQQLTQLQSQLATQTIQKQRDDVTQASHTFDKTTDKKGYYYNVSISNQLNARISQQLTFGHESSLNTTSNFTTADYVNYGVGIIAWRGARLTLSGFYEKSEESGGQFKEDIKQYGFDVLLVHRLSDHLTFGLGYHYGDIMSDVVNRSYKQNSYTVDLNYALTAKWNVGFGYRFFKTDAENPNQSFDQNRYILSMNYNF